jgi:Polypeptide deformylase
LDQVNQVRLHIVQIGEEVLWAAANELSREEIPSAKTQELIEHMRDTMHNAPRVGLAGVLYVDRMRTSTFTTLENLECFWKHLPTSDVLAKLKSGLGNRGPYV